MSTLTNQRQSASPPRLTPTELLEERRRQQVALLSQLDSLHDVPSLVLLRLAPLCTLRAFVPGTLILQERETSAFVYLVLQGTVSLTLHDRGGHEVLIGVLNRGDCFGEGPLFGDLFRGATVQAETTCYLLQLPLEDVRGIMADSPELTASLRTTYRRRLAESTLGRVPLFCNLSSLERFGIAALLQPLRYERNDTIISQGTRGDALYLIEAGQVVVECDGVTLAHLDEGNFFGEMSLLMNEPHNANIRALTPVEVLRLPAAAFTDLLERQPVLAEQLHTLAERRRAANTHTQNDQVRTQQLEAAVERGMLRGNRILVRDPHLCQDGCRICEQACATRHGHVRLRTEGVRIDGLYVVDTCRQCRFGAECVEACPEDAIRWNDDGALVITDNCTGCGECVTACPYDAVQRVALNDTTSRGPLWTLWERLVANRRNPIIPLESARPTHRADKCDLCHGYDDLACVSACPTGALKLVPVEEVFPL